MPLIDAEGLFSGDRFDLMSGEARLFWPYFWVASNSVGRIELNYDKFVARAFGRFPESMLSREKFLKLVNEYRAAWLLFVYEAPDGSVWGEWDVPEKCRPKYKLKPDERTPAPDEAQMRLWKEEYRLKKAERLRQGFDLPQTSSDREASSHPIPITVEATSELKSQGLSENREVVALPEPQREAFLKNSPSYMDSELDSERDSLKTSSTGVEALSSEAQTESTPVPEPPPLQPPKPETDPPPAAPPATETLALTQAQAREGKAAALKRAQLKWFHEEVWPLRWRPDGKQDALQAFCKAAKTEAIKNQIVSAMKAHREIYLQRENPLYVATFINKRRYEDELPPLAAMPARASPGDANGRSGAAKRSAEILDMVGNG